MPRCCSPLRGQQQECPLNATAKRRSRRKQCLLACVSPGWEGDSADFSCCWVSFGLEVVGWLQGGGATRRGQLGPAASGGGQGAPAKGTMGVSAGLARALCRGPRLAPRSALRLAAGFELLSTPCLGPSCARPRPDRLKAVLSSAGSEGCSVQCAPRCHGNQGCKVAA